MAVVFLDKNHKGNALLGVLILAGMFSIGVIIGYFGRGGGSDHDNVTMIDQFASEKALIKEALEAVDSKKLHDYSKFITKEPHIAGHRRDQELTDWIADKWKNEFGLDLVETPTYDFYLSF